MTIDPRPAFQPKFHREDKQSGMLRVAVSFEYNGDMEKYSTLDSYNHTYVASRALMDSLLDEPRFKAARALQDSGKPANNNSNSVPSGAVN